MAMILLNALSQNPKKEERLEVAGLHAYSMEMLALASRSDSPG